MRGMIEKVSNPHDNRSAYYQTTTEFLQHLGIPSTSSLPDFEKLVAGIVLPETPAVTTEVLESQQQEVAEEPILQAVFEENTSGEPTEVLIMADEPTGTVIITREEELPELPNSENMKTLNAVELEENENSANKGAQ